MIHKCYGIATIGVLLREACLCVYVCTHKHVCVSM